MSKGMTDKIFRRPVFNKENYVSGKGPVGLKPCCNCGESAVEEFCNSGQGMPTELDYWVPLCIKCKDNAKSKPRNWRDITDDFLREAIDFDSI